MNEPENPEQRLSRYRRFLDTDDARKTLAEADRFFGLETIVFPLLNETGGADKVMAREGARSYSQFLRTLVERTEEAVKEEKKQSERRLVHE